MKKKGLILIGACLIALASHADTYPYLTFQKADGNLVSIGVDQLEMTFSDGNLILVNNAETEQKLTLADLASMYFTAADVTAIDDIEAKTTDGKVEAYSLQGMRCGTYSSMTEMQESLSAGMYIVKGNGKTKKVVIK